MRNGGERVRILEYQDIRVSGYRIIRISEYQDIRVSGYQDIRLSDYQIISHARMNGTKRISGRK